MLLRGREHGVWGTFVSHQVNDAVAATISVGADQSSPSSLHKGDPHVPNEDALCVVDAGDVVAMAVADGHLGIEASHLLIERLHETWLDRIPLDPARLTRQIEDLVDPPGGDPRSASTLVATVVDRRSRTGFGVSYGDSTCTHVGKHGGGAPLNRRKARYVITSRPRTLRRPNIFRLGPCEAGDLVLVFTDGIDECHYREPDTSVQPRHLADTWRTTDGVPVDFAEAVTTMALQGVDGHPGGQDNVALVVTAV